MENTPLSKPVRCIVKLGGAAITWKNELEKVNQENLKIVSQELRQAFITSQNLPGMDWSKKPGDSEVSCDLNDFKDISLDSPSFIVVHGAGSFGHFQASKSGVHKGGLDQPVVKAGFVATRISVTTLNLEIVRVLAREGIPSVGMSPFSCGWSTSERNVRGIEREFICLCLLHMHIIFSTTFHHFLPSKSGPILLSPQIASVDLSMVATAIDSGFVPVLHGDAVLDEIQGCTILSGDVIIRHLADFLKPEYVVFLTDVLGVYDRPPTEPNAVLLREIAVNEEGSWSIINPRPQDMNKQVEITVAAHDTTGGMATKIAEAAMIAKLGIDVYIVKAASRHSLRALRGEVRGNSIPDDWDGTILRFVGRGSGAT